ncbi:MAG: response regulator [Calditrichaeota bacterium]|nr:response regulator [Calditrichota bacterium]
MRLAADGIFEQKKSDIHMLYLKQIFNQIYIDSYRNQLCQFNHFLEVLLYNIHADEKNHSRIQDYFSDMLDELRIHNSDLEIANDSLDWLKKSIRHHDYCFLQQLIEDTLLENNHFASISRANRTVVIIDPKLTVLKFLNLVLKQNGIQSLRFQKSDQAFKYLNHIDSEIGTIICEYNLPDLHAADVLKRLKQSNCSGSTVLFIANYNDTAEIREKFGIGTVDYLNKPIQADIVISKIKALSR